LEREVLEKIEQINSVLVDRDKLTPLSSKIFILWGVVTSILVFTIPSIFISDTLTTTEKLSYSASIFIVVFSIAFVFETFFVKKENKKAGFEKFTKLQKDIESVFALNISIAIILTLAFSLSNNGVFIFSLWLFLIGASYFIVGIMSKKIFKIYGLILVGVSAVFTLLIIFSIVNNRELLLFDTTFITENVFQIGQYLNLIFGGFGHIVLGVLIERENRVV